MDLFYLLKKFFSKKNFSDKNSRYFYREGGYSKISFLLIKSFCCATAAHNWGTARFRDVTTAHNRQLQPIIIRNLFFSKKKFLQRKIIAIFSEQGGTLKKIFSKKFFFKFRKNKKNFQKKIFFKKKIFFWKKNFFFEKKFFFWKKILSTDLLFLFQKTNKNFSKKKKFSERGVLWKKNFFLNFFFVFWN